jgi:hypothetical protein
MEGVRLNEGACRFYSLESFAESIGPATVCLASLMWILPFFSVANPFFQFSVENEGSFHRVVVHGVIVH